MADNNIYGVDFIARCMAGEALEKADQKSWTLVAGNNINILSDEEEKTETISATYEVDDALSSTSTNPVENRVIYNALQNVEIDVDNALSTTSENPVQNKVITAALKTKPTSVLPDGTVINDQKIMALTRAQYNAIQSKDPNTYYMITDDPVPEAPMVVRTAYVDMLNDCVLTVDGNNYTYEFAAPANFEKVDVYIRCHYIWRNTTWTGDNQVKLAHQLSLTPDVSAATDGRTIVWRHGFDKANMPGVNWQGDFLDQAITLSYDSATNKLKMKVGAPSMWRCEGDWSGATTANSPVTVSGFVLDALGYVAYGADNINVTTGLTAGTGIDMTNDVISINMPVGSEIDMVVDPATYELTVTLYDQDTIPISTATVDLPLESMVVNGTYDSATDEIVLTLQSGQTIRFSVASLVSGLETSAHAAATYQTIAGMSAYETSAHAAQTYQPIGSYATQSDISDMATETWVGQQGFLTNADEVPTVGSTDDGKVLKATYSGGTGSYAWATESGYTLPYATQTTKGGARIWTTVENGETVLNIATEDPV